MKSNRAREMNDILDDIRIGDEEDAIKCEESSKNAILNESQESEKQLYLSKNHEKLIREDDSNEKSNKIKDKSIDQKENVKSDDTKVVNNKKIKLNRSRMNRKRRSKSNIKPFQLIDITSKDDKDESKTKMNEIKVTSHKIQMRHIKKLSLSNLKFENESSNDQIQQNDHKLIKNSKKNLINSSDFCSLKTNESVICMHSSDENLNESSCDQNDLTNSEKNQFNQKSNFKIKNESKSSSEEDEEDYLINYFNHDEESSSNCLSGFQLNEKKEKKFFRKLFDDKSNSSNKGSNEKQNAYQYSNDSGNFSDVYDFDQYEFEKSDDEFKEGSLFFRSAYHSKEEYVAERNKMFEQNKNKDYLKHEKKRLINNQPNCSNSKALNCPIVNGESSSKSAHTVNNRITKSICSSIYSINDSLIEEATLLNVNGMHKQPLDLNNNSNNLTSAASNSIQQLNKQQYKQSTSSQLNRYPKKYSTPLNLITESEPSPTVESKPIITRPPILKDQQKTSSLSSNTSTSSGILTGSSFDSNLSIENLASTSSFLPQTNPISKIAKLARNHPDFETNTSNFIEIHHHNKSICQRSQSQDEINFKMSQPTKSSDKNRNFKPIEQESSFQEELEKLKHKQEQDIQELFRKYEDHNKLPEQQNQNQNQEKKLQEKKRNIIQNQDFACNKIIEEDHRSTHKLDEQISKENAGSSLISESTRVKLRDSIITRIKTQNGGILPTTSSGIGPGLSWASKFKDLHPLKKAVSEPNLKVNKSGLKQRTHRKNSPHALLKKRQKTLGRLGKGPSHLIQGSDSTNTHSAPVSASSSMESSTPPNSKPESIPGSPPTYICGLPGSITTGNSASSTPQYNEPSIIHQSSPFNDNSLYSSPSLPNIHSRYPADIRRFYMSNSSTSPTQQNYNRIKQQYKPRFEHTIDKDTLNLQPNQSFINDRQFMCSAFRRAHCSPLLSNSLDSPITQRDSPPAQNLRNQLETSAFQSKPYSPYTVSYKSLSNRKLNRTQSAPLPFGVELLQAAAALNFQQNNSPLANIQTNYSPLINSTTSNTSASTFGSHDLVLQKMKKHLLTKQQKSFGNLVTKTSFEENMPEKSNSEKRILKEKNIDSGSASFDENYNESLFKSDLEKETQLQQLQFLEKIQQDLYRMKSNQTQNPPEVNPLLLQKILSLSQQHQAQSSHLGIESSPIDMSIFNNQAQAYSSTSAQPNVNYAKLIMSSHTLPTNGLNSLKRAFSQPMVSPTPANLNSNILQTAFLLNQPSLTSLVAPFKELNLSHGNLNLIQTSATSGLNSPDHLINENVTALVSDEDMLKHDCSCGNTSIHLERGERITAIYHRLLEKGLTNSCYMLPPRKASIEELKTVHSPTYCDFFATEPIIRQKYETLQSSLNELPIKSYVRMNCGGVGIDSDTIWNEQFTWSAVRAAAGCVIDLAQLVAKNKLKNGFAIVRPPGHHAEYQHPMGFCYFNSIAIAAKQLKSKLGLKKILILDFDVHHGNGTQKTFYDDEQVLYISLHRHDKGNFYPGTGDLREIGSGGLSLGKTINISWYGDNNLYGDAEYLAAFRTIVLPVIEEYQPEIVLVSCGFDAACGHPPQLGGYNLSPAIFGWMVSEVMKLRNGKIVLALEGGYEIESISNCAEQVVRALLEQPIDRISENELTKRPNSFAVEVLQKVLEVQSPYWKCLKKQSFFNIECSHIEFLTQSARFLSSITCIKTEEVDEVDEPMED